MNGSLLLPALLTGIFCYLGAIESPWLFGMSCWPSAYRRVSNRDRIWGYSGGCSMWISGSGSFHCQSFDRGRDK